MNYGIVCRNWYCGRNECWLLSFALSYSRPKWNFSIELNAIYVNCSLILMVCWLCLIPMSNVYWRSYICYMLYASASGMIGNWTACKHCPLPIYYHEKNITYRWNGAKQWNIEATHLQKMMSCSSCPFFIAMCPSERRRRKKTPTKDMNAAT